jgi:hypothetical protein
MEVRVRGDRTCLFRMKDGEYVVCQLEAVVSQQSSNILLSRLESIQDENVRKVLRSTYGTTVGEDN